MEEKRLRKAEKAQCPSRIVRCVLSSPAFVTTVLPALPKSSSALQVLGHCFLSPPGDGARGSQASRKAQCLLSSKKGTRFIRRGPQAKTQSKTASAPLGESKITPRLEHTCSSRTTRAVRRASGRRALPFPPPPCRTPAGTAQPATSTSPVAAVSRLCQGRFAPGVGCSLPQTASVSHREQGNAPHARGDTNFASDCGHRCGELAWPQLGPRSRLSGCGGAHRGRSGHGELWGGPRR